MTAPALSIVIASRTGLGESGTILGWLGGQTIAARTEIIVVAPRGSIDPRGLEEIGGFHSVRLLELEAVENRGTAVAHGLLAASAELAGVCENHGFPAADTLERLTAAITDQDGAVAPAIRTANPETRRSLAMYLAAYGHASAPADPSPRTSLPFHNSVFRTAMLRRVGDALPALLSDESRLHGEILRQGLLLRIVPEAITWHVNESRWSRAVTDVFILGAKFGSVREARSSWLRRLAHLPAIPVIALLRFRSLLRIARRAEDTRDRIGWIVPMLAVTASSGALGEAWGAIRRPTRFPPDFDSHEFHIRGRLAGVAPTTPWLRELMARLPPNVA
jgi:hypothetical protein